MKKVIAVSAVPFSSLSASISQHPSLSHQSSADPPSQPWTSSFQPPFSLLLSLLTLVPILHSTLSVPPSSIHPVQICIKLYYMLSFCCVSSGCSLLQGSSLVLFFSFFNWLPCCNLCSKQQPKLHTITVDLYRKHHYSKTQLRLS